MPVNFNCDPCNNDACENLIVTDDRLYKRWIIRAICAFKAITGALARDSTVQSIDSKIATSDTDNVTIVSMPPVTVAGGAGDASAANQVLEIAELTSIDAKITACNTGSVTVVAMPAITATVSGSVSVSSSALPAGAATSALQTTGNNSLSSIDGKITACNTGAVVVSSSALPSGAATSALQTTGNNSLSSIDGKITACNTGAVTVSSSALPSGAATSALQTTGNNSLSSIDGKITACNTGAVVVASGSMAVTQTVTASAGNSSSTNLDVGNTYTFTGSAASTLGVAGIQVSLFADKNCIIKVQQSPDNTPHWDLTDTYYYTANSNFGVTVQAISSYVRVVVTTNNETTTVFRLQTALCPIVEAVPRSLDVNGNLKVASPVDNLNFAAFNNTMGESRVSQAIRLVGAIFEGTTIDPRFWIAAAAGTAATIAQANAQILLTSGTSNAAAVTLYSARRARYISGHSIRYRAAVQVSSGVANNVRSWGIGYGATMPTVTDGAWFRMNGTAFELQVMKATAPTTITAFNGNHGATFTPGANVNTYEIYWTNSKVYFVVNGVLLHTHDASAATWTSTKNFHVFASSLNSAGIGASETLAIRTASIHRFSPESTAPQYYNLTGNAATHVLKLSAGTLHKIIFNNTSGVSFIIYDSTTAGGAIIGTVTTSANALGSWDYHCPFFNGLTIVTTGNSLDLTVVYE